MNSRLQLILDLENLSPARLADMIGIQRSGLSHILSGRNKPSFEFINKLLMKFPDINAEWLITGKGKPLKESDTPSQNKNQNEMTEADGRFPYSPALSEKKDSDANSSISTMTDREVHDDFPEDNSTNLFSFANFEAEPDFAQYAENEKDSNHLGPNRPRQNQIFENNQQVVRKNKGVKRIIVFYNDGSFEEFSQDKK